MVHLRKRALITGITGQDGSYLCEHLVDKGYDVFGLVRRSSADTMRYIESLRLSGKVKIIHGDIRDKDAIRNALTIAQPDEIYNLASQSHVGVSHECQEETHDVNYICFGNLVTTAHAQNKNIKIYQASSSEMFGNAPAPQNEKTPLQALNPYAESKCRAYKEFVRDYRDKTGAFICSGFLYNHESPRRGKNFVTRKITHSLAKIKLGQQDCFDIGNMSTTRDWGYAKDYVDAMWRMLQHDTPDDYVIATGKSHSVRDVITTASQALGMKLTWHGSGINEVATDSKGTVIVKVNPKFFRPTEPQELRGNATKAYKTLNWQPTISFEELISMMVKNDLHELS